MVVCRYFLQPSGCRFGDKCRYEHVADDEYAAGENYGGRGPQRDSWQSGRDYRPPGPSQPQRFQVPKGGYDHQDFRGNSGGFQNSGYRQPNPSSFNITARFNTSAPPTTDAEILQDIGKDVQSFWAQTDSSAFQKGKIWPFSTYSYISPDGTIHTDPLFGLADHSMEELRVAAYSSRGDQDAIKAYIDEVNKQGSTVRLMCTSICNATSLPHSEGAKKIVEEVRRKAAEHDALFKQSEGNRTSMSAGDQRPFGGFSSPSPQSAMGFSVTPQPSPIHPPKSSTHYQNGQISSGPASGGPRDASFSDTNMLSAEDFMQFASPEFTHGKVPYRPPPRNLC